LTNWVINLLSNLVNISPELFVKVASDLILNRLLFLFHVYTLLRPLCYTTRTHCFSVSLIYHTYELLFGRFVISHVHIVVRSLWVIPHMLFVLLLLFPYHLESDREENESHRRRCARGSDENRPPLGIEAQDAH
jgi:hypothetical protein